jgi:hypothetical protein
MYPITSGQFTLVLIVGKSQPVHPLFTENPFKPNIGVVAGNEEQWRFKALQEEEGAHAVAIAPGKLQNDDNLLVLALGSCDLG